MLYAKLELSCEITKDTPPQFPCVIRMTPTPIVTVGATSKLHFMHQEMDQHVAEMLFLNLHNEDHFLTKVS
jgi:hypothetical protein